MTQNVPATREEGTQLAVDRGQQLVPEAHDPQHQEVQQNVSVALVPLALVVLLLLAFIAAAWTFLAAQPAA